jgi:hypothetical protein
MVNTQFFYWVPVPWWITTVNLHVFIYYLISSFCCYMQESHIDENKQKRPWWKIHTQMASKNETSKPLINCLLTCFDENCWFFGAF